MQHHRVQLPHACAAATYVHACMCTVHMGDDPVMTRTYGYTTCLPVSLLCDDIWLSSLAAFQAWLGWEHGCKN